VNVTRSACRNPLNPWVCKRKLRRGRTLKGSREIKFWSGPTDRKSQKYLRWGAWSKKYFRRLIGRWSRFKEKCWFDMDRWISQTSEDIKDKFFLALISLGGIEVIGLGSTWFIYLILEFHYFRIQKWRKLWLGIESHKFLIREVLKELGPSNHRRSQRCWFVMMGYHSFESLRNDSFHFKSSIREFLKCRKDGPQVLVRGHIEEKSREESICVSPFSFWRFKSQGNSHQDSWGHEVWNTFLSKGHGHNCWSLGWELAPCVYSHRHESQGPVDTHLRVWVISCGEIEE
jgi:hypothetical protein